LLHTTLPSDLLATTKKQTLLPHSITKPPCTTKSTLTPSTPVSFTDIDLSVLHCPNFKHRKGYRILGGLKNMLLLMAGGGKGRRIRKEIGIKLRR
jgi:hypothetical protein